ncbi:MAG: hypothetical protein AAFX03_03210 [Pseudomonadota bacterium]
MIRRSPAALLIALAAIAVLWTMTAPTRTNGAVAAGPLAAEPLVEAAIAYTALGDHARSIAALDAALRRSPRHRQATLLRAEAALAVGDAARAVSLIGEMYTIDDPNRDAWLGALVDIARRPEHRPAVLSALETGPLWAVPLSNRLIDDAAPPDLLFESARRTPPVQERYLHGLLQDGRIEHAYLAWLEFQQGQPVEDLTWPYDGVFEGLSGAAPFNWRLLSRQAELAPGDGLHAAYFGPGPTVFAEQILAAPPGLYRLSATMRGRSEPGGATLQWVVRCMPETGFEARLAPATLTEQAQTYFAAIEIPASDCSFQRLSIEGVPGARASRASAVTEQIRLRPDAPD